MYQRYYHWRFDPLTETYELWVGDNVVMHKFGSVVAALEITAKKLLLHKVFDAQPYFFYQEV